jgi:nitroimidazol reductase NimA-like FMN-containing flavoprotein (pyridoxamine 5'-phosphate oxidase superfamily)
LGVYADDQARVSRQHSPHGRRQGGHQVVGELTAEEIDQMLRSEAVGRIGCHAFGRPYVVPITYAYDGDAVYGHSREGLKLRMMRSHPRVCFEVDRMDDLTSWQSVIALGTFAELGPPEAKIAMELLHRRLGPRVPSATSTPDGLHHVSKLPWSVFRILLDQRSGRYERPDDCR